jgi:PAS domain S-box-containing protein
VLHFDPAGCLVEAPVGPAERLLGVSLQAGVALEALALAPPLARALPDAVRRVLSGGGVESFEARLGEGEAVRHCLLHVGPEWGRGGHVAGAMVLVRDLTTRRHAEEGRAALAEQAARQALALEGALVATWDVDLPSGTVHYGPGWSELVGRPASELPPTREGLRALVHPEDRQQAFAALGDYLAGRLPEYAAEFRLETRHRGWRWMQSRGRVVERDAEGRPVRVLGTNVDVTTRRAALEALRTSEARLAGIVGSAMDAILSADAQGRVVVFNTAAERMLGLPAAEALGGPLDRFLPERFRARHPEHLARFAASGGSRRTFAGDQALSALRADGREFPVEASISLTGAGAEALFTVILRDVSERKLLEGQLRQAQKMEAVGQLAGGVAHDFNNLLTAITAYSELALADVDPGSRIGQDLGEIHQAALRAGQLTRQLLAFSRQQVLRLQVLDLNEVLAGAERLLRRLVGESVLLEVLQAAAPARVTADPGQLEQVLVNLAVNARDAMPHGGVLTVESAGVTLSEEEGARAGGLPPGRYVRLSVADTGTGMDEALRARIFEPFFTTKPVGKGTGLGLATVYGIVKQLGGGLQVESAPGQGSTFSVLLPYAEGELEPGARPGASGALRGSETLLLVEDEQVVRSSLKRMLERHGYRVLEARHGADALLVLRERRGEVDLVLTDVRMPEMGGQELVARLRTEAPGLPVLYLSGYADVMPEVGGEGPAVAFVEKPVSATTLLEHVRGALGPAR